MKQTNLKTFAYVTGRDSIAMTILSECNRLGGQLIRSTAYELRAQERKTEGDNTLFDKSTYNGFMLDGVDTNAVEAFDHGKLVAQLNAAYKLTLCSAELIVRLATHVDMDDYGRTVAPFKWMLAKREDGTSRFYRCIADVLVDNEKYAASKRQRQRQAGVVAFGELLSEEEHSKASAQTKAGAEAAAAEMRAQLEQVVGSALSSRYDPRDKDTATLFKDLRAHIRDLGAQPDLVAAAAVWRSAMAMKKSAIGELNPRTGQPYNMQLDPAIISLAVQLKRDGYQPDSEKNRTDDALKAELADL